MPVIKYLVYEPCKMLLSLPSDMVVPGEEKLCRIEWPGQQYGEGGCVVMLSKYWQHIIAYIHLGCTPRLPNTLISWCVIIWGHPSLCSFTFSSLLWWTMCSGRKPKICSAISPHWKLISHLSCLFNLCWMESSRLWKSCLGAYHALIPNWI